MIEIYNVFRIFDNKHLFSKIDNSFFLQFLMTNPYQGYQQPTPPGSQQAYPQYVPPQGYPYPPQQGYGAPQQSAPSYPQIDPDQYTGQAPPPQQPQQPYNQQYPYAAPPAQPIQPLYPENTAYPQSPQPQYPPPYAPPPQQTAPQSPNPQQPPLNPEKYKHPTKIEAVWVESELPEHMLFLDKPGGKIIKPYRGAFYPPVDQVVYDRNGIPFVSIYPKTKNSSQKIAKETEKLNKAVVKPLGKELNKLNDEINKGVRSIAKIFK